MAEGEDSGTFSTIQVISQQIMQHLLTKDQHLLTIGQFACTDSVFGVLFI